jgi:hypothetical protein
MYYIAVAVIVAVAILEIAKQCDEMQLMQLQICLREQRKP